MTIGERVRQLRRSHKYTQEYVSKRVSVSRVAIATLETNGMNPSYQTICEIANVFNLSLPELFFGVDNPICSGDNVYGFIPFDAIGVDIE